MAACRWERARILQGRPAPGSELTEEFNPLEAGLYQEVSLAKVSSQLCDNPNRLWAHSGCRRGSRG